MRFTSYALALIISLTMLYDPILSRPQVELIGAGATFPYPLYSKWFDVYYKKTGTKVNYQSIGSGGGIRQIMQKTVDFGATDGYMSDAEMGELEEKILHIPTALGAVVITYNIPGNPRLRLGPDVIADIFLGNVTEWNDPEIKKLNQNVDLPQLDIVVVHRSDGSGTTFIFTDYLGKVSKAWKIKVGTGKSVRWPVGVGGKGNEGVSGLVRMIPGSIGYVEQVYAEQNNLPLAAVKNKSGNFILPDTRSVSIAADIKLPDDLRVSITDTEAPLGYPISGFTWLLVYKEQAYSSRTFKHARALVDLLWWCVHDAQKYNEPLLYARIPELVREKAEVLLRSITYKGTSILNGQNKQIH